MLQLLGPKLIRRQPLLHAALDNLHVALAGEDPEVALFRADAAVAVDGGLDLREGRLEDKGAAVAVAAVRDGLGFCCHVVDGLFGAGVC